MPDLDGWTLDDLDPRRLDGQPDVAMPFDCGREEQNAYLREHAWDDQQNGFSVTWMAEVKGIIAGYVTLTMDGLELYGFERPDGGRYKEYPAIKIGQLGVDKSFQGLHIGQYLIAFALIMATSMADQIGCRYLTVDAKRDVVDWYKAQGFKENKLREAERGREARAAGRDRTDAPVSLRLDIRDGSLVRDVAGLA